MITKKVITKMIISSLLCAATASAGGWANMQPAYNTREDHATVRVEGGTKLAEHVNMYAFMDLDTTKADPFNFESIYAETRLKLGLDGLEKRLKSFELAAEYNGSTGGKDTVRFGLLYTPHVGKGNFTQFKLLPFETSGEKGAHVGVYSSQTLGKRLTLSALAEYNLRPRAIYFEGEANIKMTQPAALLLQARGFGKIDGKIDVAPVIGLKYTF